MSINTAKQDESLRQVSKTNTNRRLFRYLLGYKRKITIILMIMAVSIAIITTNPIIFEVMINDCVLKRNVPGLIGYAALAIILNVILVFLIRKRMRMMGEISNDILMKIRRELYTHLQKLSISFFDSRPTGKILARLIGDINSLRDVLEASVITLLPEFVTIITVAVIMLIKNSRLALAVFLTLPILFAGITLIGHFAHGKWQIHRKKTSNVNAYVYENFSGINVIQSFTAEERSIQTFDGLLNEQKKSYLDAVKIQDAFESVLNISWALGTILLYYIGIILLGNNTVEIGTFIAFSTYLGMFWAPINKLGQFYNKLTTNLSGAERVFELIDQKPDITDTDQAKILPDIQGRIEFRNVTFCYDRDEEVLSNVSFTIKPGETVALVGETGAGKSTIANLISRFYDIQKGKIWIDYDEIRQVTINNLRSVMGIMTQDNFLFSGTVRDNIRYGKLDATDEEIITACKAVHAHDFIMAMENGYDTEISERGSRLSIGQKQLIAFARTMVSSPRILILDEATSNIDTKTERLVQMGIETLLKGRTSIVIAHRLSTIKKADRIFVIKDGKIAEEGNHGQLMNQKGIYYNLQKAALEL